MQQPASSAAVESELVSLSNQDPLRVYLRSLWNRREFVVALAENDLRSRHMNSLLGQAWYLINPALNIGVYFLIFGVVLGARRGVEDYVAFLVTGVMFYRFMQATVTSCSSSMRKNIGLIRTVQFPRTLIPLSIVIENVLQFLPSAALIMVVAVVDAGAPVWQWFAIPLVLLAAALISLGLGLFTARLGSTFSDLQSFLPHVFRIGLYVSGVLFSVNDKVTNTTIKQLFVLNPLYDVVTAARWALTGRPMEPMIAVALLAWSVFALTGGLLFFRRGEHRYGA